MENWEDINRALWDQKARVHPDTEFYQMEAFRAGHTSLQALELRELGADVPGKSLLHLQCHFGQDTLSWARMGAQVTGADLSPEAIHTARALAAELGIPAEFVCAPLYDLPAHLHGQFDIVFTSYGTIGWLPDLSKWATVIRHFLKPGGIFYIADFHPVLWMYSNDFSKLEYPYLNVAPIVENTEGTYADREAAVAGASVSWNHGLGEIITALCHAGLHIEHLHEYDYSTYDCFQNLVRDEQGHYRVRGLEGLIPMMYSIRARG